MYDLRCDDDGCGRWRCGADGGCVLSAAEAVEAAWRLYGLVGVGGEEPHPLAVRVVEDEKAVVVVRGVARLTAGQVRAVAAAVLAAGEAAAAYRKPETAACRRGRNAAKAKKLKGVAA